jgi:hypothetical protein
VVDKPVWITGFDHRMETHSLGARDLTTSPSTARAAEVAGVADGPVDVAELHAPYAHQEIILRRRSDWTTGDHQPVGRGAGRQPAHVGRPHPHRRGRQPASPRVRPGRAVAHATSGPCLQQNLVCVLEGDVMAERCAVIGVGQTHHKAKREDVSIAGLVREAAKMALADADLTWSDIDAVVIGKAPDMFEGNMMPEIYLAPPSARWASP